MEFKIKICCGKCACDFELCSNNFKPSEELACPNCGQALPDSIYKKLKSGITLLGEVPEYTEDPEHQFSLRVTAFGTAHDLFDR